MNPTELTITREMFAKQAEERAELISALRDAEFKFSGMAGVGVPEVLERIRAILAKVAP